MAEAAVDRYWTRLVRRTLRPGRQVSHSAGRHLPRFRAAGTDSVAMERRGAEATGCSGLADARVEMMTTPFDERPRLRVCMPTWRGFARRAFNCSLYEAQDVLAETDDVDLISVEPGVGLQFRERWQGRLVRRDASHRLVFMNPGLQRVRLTQ